MILLILIDIYYQIFSAKHDIEIDRELTSRPSRQAVFTGTSGDE